MKSIVYAISVVFGLCYIPWVTSAQPLELNHLGQTPGGAAYNLTYHNDSERLIVGCGNSIWIYNVSNLINPDRIAMAPFHGLVNESIVKDGVLFAAITHDGVWALDFYSQILAPYHHFTTPGLSAAYDIWLWGDTLYLADSHDAVILTYDPSNGFTEHERFGTPDVMTVARRGDIIATGSRGVLNGTVSVYHADDLSDPVDSWTDATLFNIEDIRFADNRDDIIYVCGGTNNLGFSGQFYAFHFDGEDLEPADHYTIGGIPGLANAQIINMDSRNDTLFLATTAGLNGFESTVPVLDATGLPEEPMELIGHIRPGLWYFDVALFGDSPYLSIASEWFGLWINDITDLAPLDTVAVVPTGGWCQRCYVRGDTLWACMRGYGLSAYHLDDLSYDSGYKDDFELLHLDPEFTFDCAFLEDSILVVGHHLSYSVYDLTPWHAGLQPVPLGVANTSILSSVECVAVMETDSGNRIIGGLFDGIIEIRDLEAPPDFPLISAIDIGGSPSELMISGDTLIVGAEIQGDPAIAIYRIINDDLELLASAEALRTVGRIARKDGVLAAALGTDGAAWYRFDGESITELGRIEGDLNIVDVELSGGLLYAADKFDGVLIYNIEDPSDPVLLATSPGTGGWQGMFGSTSITVGPDRTIYLSDFNGGVFVIEPLPGTHAHDFVTNHPEHLRIDIRPNPVHAYGFIRAPAHASIDVYDFGGRHLRRLWTGIDRDYPIQYHELVWHPASSMAPGSYIICARNGNHSEFQRILYIP